MQRVLLVASGLVLSQQPEADAGPNLLPDIAKALSCEALEASTVGCLAEAKP